MSPTSSVPLAHHISELRGRLMWVLLFVFIGGCIGYALNDSLLRILQLPLHDSLYYNTPGGAFSFVMKLCVTFGIIMAVPALSYHTFAFLGPVISSKTKRMFVQYVLMSVILAALGIAFAYFISLPASLNFLMNFSQGDINPLITANEYFNFVLAYIAGFALLFQVPLMIAFANRIKPLPPKKLLGATKFVVLASFIVAAIITPTPDPINQGIMAGPIILLYLLSIVFIALHPSRFKAKREAKKVIPMAQPKPSIEHTTSTRVRSAGARQLISDYSFTPSPKQTAPVVRAETKPEPMPQVRPGQRFFDIVVTS